MIPETLRVALWGLGAILSAATLLWIVSRRLKDASIVDPFWGPGFALVAGAYVVAEGRLGARGLLALGLVGLWAGRLGLHLILRNRREGEDPRYQAMAKPHGESWWWVSLFKVFWLQAFLLWLISAPLLGAVRSDTPLGPLDGVGVLLFVIGLGFEAIGDRQLVRFRADPRNRGRVLDSGLWRYSRHPNYFGDAVLWWGFWFVAAAGGAVWTAFGPALMTFLLVKVSGVSLLEEGLRQSRPGYADYVDRTSSFIPWPPKK